MKTKIFFILTALILFACGRSKDDDSAVAAFPIKLPPGAFIPAGPTLTMNADHLEGSSIKRVSYNFNAIGFNADEISKIQGGLNVLGSLVATYLQQQSAGVSPTNFEACVSRSTTRYKALSWDRNNNDSTVTPQSAARMAMHFFNHVAGKSIGKIRMADAPLNAIGGFAGLVDVQNVTTSADSFKNVDLMLNRQYLAKSYATPQDIAGVLFHEILHNIGWVHPVTGDFGNDYAGTFVFQAGLCVANGMN